LPNTRSSPPLPIVVPCATPRENTYSTRPVDTAVAFATAPADTSWCPRTSTVALAVAPE